MFLSKQKLDFKQQEIWPVSIYDCDELRAAFTFLVEYIERDFF